MPPQGQRFSSRNAKGRKWHGRGYRERGYLYVQLHRSYAHFSRYHRVNENETISELLDGLYSDLSVEDPVIPPDVHIEFFCKRTRLEDSEHMVKMILDGGEAIYAKAFDSMGNMVREID